MTFRTLIAALGIAALAACTPPKSENTSAPQVAPVLVSEDAKDTHSFARPEEARVTHVSLDLAADFDKKVMAGAATLDVSGITADSRANAVQAQAAQTKVLLAQATLRNSIAWFITMAWIVGGIVVVSEVIL